MTLPFAVPTLSVFRHQERVPDVSKSLKPPTATGRGLPDPLFSLMRITRRSIYRTMVSLEGQCSIKRLSFYA